MIRPSARTSSMGACPEIELLLRCARTRIDPESAERIRGLLREEIDWDRLIPFALRHGVMPLLHRGLEATDPLAVPEGALERVRDSSRAIAGRNLFLTSELLRVLDLLEKQGIPALPFKGPVLAVMAYGGLSLRQFGDLDILVHRRDLTRAGDLLADRASAPAFQIVADHEADPLRSDWEHHLKLVREDGRAIVELHWELIEKGYGFPLDPERLWPRLRRIPIAGRSLPCLPAEDLLLFLCAHGCKHVWKRLGWICDVAELVRSHEMDWGMVSDRASALGGRRMLFLGLNLASDLLGVSRQEAIAGRVRRDHKVGSLTREVRAGLVRDWRAPRDEVGGDWRFYLESRERLSDRIRCSRRLGRNPRGVGWSILPPHARCLIVVSRIVSPSNRDTASLRLPDLLYPLYYLVRPFRLAAKYARRPSLLYRMIGDLLKSS